MDIDMDKLERQLRELIAAAERAGWNAAINAARQILPAEFSLKVRELYRPVNDGLPTQLETALAENH